MENAQTEPLFQMELLPLEVVEVIVQYLTVRDVRACSAASWRLRELFNEDCLWKRYCDETLAEYLRKTPCKVEPKFVIPEVEDSTLSPLCRWRVSYMRENHLWNNWRLGRHTQEQPKCINYLTGSFRVESFLTNDCMLVLHQKMFMLFDVRECKLEIIEPNITLTNNCYYVKTVTNMVICVFKSFVQVYQLNLTERQCSLKHSFFFEESEQISLNVSDDLQRALRECGYAEPFIVVGTIFVGIIRDKDKMYIWNVETGQKLKEEVYYQYIDCPKTEFQSSVYLKHSNTNNVVINVNQYDYDTFFAYSLTQLDFLPFKQTFRSQNSWSTYSVQGDYVGITVEDLMRVYNYRTSQLLLEVPGWSKIQVLDKNFLFTQCKVMRVFNPSRPDVEPEALPLGEIHRFDVMSSRLLQIEKNGDLEIWIAEGICKKTFKKTAMRLGFYEGNSMLNQSCTRLYFKMHSFRREREHFIVHFW